MDDTKGRSVPTRGIEVWLPEWVHEAMPAAGVLESVEDRMRLVIELSRENVLRREGGPFAAAVFERDTGRLVSVGLNSVERLRNSALHAEMTALMFAQQRLGVFTLAAEGLPAHELVSSCAPCAMCLGAVLWSGVRRLVWGAGREDALRIQFDEGPVFPESIRYVEERGVEMMPHVLREEARAVLQLYAGRGGLIYNG